MGKEMARRDPFDVFAPFVHFNRRWNEALRGSYGDEPANRMLVPAMDVVESEDELVLTAELPGIAKEQVKITVEDGVLTLSGEKKFERDQKNKDYHVVERRYGTFHRQVTLPSQVDATKVSANFADGVLIIHVPKVEAAKPREITIS